MEHSGRIAHLRGEDYLNVKYSHTRRQWMQRYFLAGFFACAGLLELFLSAFDSYRVLVYTEAIIDRHRFLYMGVLRVVNVLTYFQLATLLLPHKLHPPMTSVMMRHHTTEQAIARHRHIHGTRGVGGDGGGGDEWSERVSGDGTRQSVVDVTASDSEDDGADDGGSDGDRGTTAGGDGGRKPTRLLRRLRGFNGGASSTDRLPRPRNSRRDGGGRRASVFHSMVQRRDGGFHELELDGHGNGGDGGGGGGGGGDGGGNGPVVQRVADGLGLVPLAVLLPAVVLAGFVISVQYGACKSPHYYAVAWMLVSCFNIGVSLTLLVRWLGPFPSARLKSQLTLLHPRTFTWGPTVWMVLLCVLMSTASTGLLVHRDAVAADVTLAEVVQQVDMVLAMVVGMATHAKRQSPDSREHRKWAQLCSNRAFAIMLLLAFSQFAICFANLDNYVRLNSPGFVHTRLPLIDHWALGLYPFFILARLGLGLLLARSCIACHV
ncbi:hypothetical protein PTSG_07673 [Salpingoeca rosetta]|uniref:Uncharacterized protein n=1 Tax=Salpingoeca rosetta (strain ATCC 50818 / BSB-021) TaxID=946362 RepID=F2UHF9_SALR5|nr:uncharacterized protein PTSG_07673 [Salpingoeca rosetta]EGD76558.1 hypothetical protein PTSG_07673 [Salpingoeca rosetta]|eukprot:XP_004991472.1 hypothetical protein PTSG_07673 [Salpingoeca rosetta]